MHRREVVSYVRRGERMTRGQQRAFDEQVGRLLRDVAELPPGPLDTRAWFGRRVPLVCEIGSGMGEGTAALAAARPDLDHLAVEVYTPGLAQLLLRIERAGLTNLRLLRGDAIHVLREHLEPGSLVAVRAFFPDPWPKTRHHKRRLVTPAFVALAASRLTPGGRLQLATDWADYAEQMLAVCSAEPLLRNLHGDSWGPRPSWRPVTKFEERALEAGRVVRDLEFERVDTGSGGRGG